jgi:hypothetical protein
MSKTEIDYSNTIIYKITCKDPLVTDLYVGHTTNFVQRKHGHKQSCINEKSCNYNCKLYKTIRANGGWDNWVMEIVAFFKCNDLYEARIKEQEYFTSLNATLNSLEPLPKPKSIETPEEVNKEFVKKNYFCETCNGTLQDNQLLESHNQTKKHCKKVIGLDTVVCYKYTCNICHFKCFKSGDYKRHISTSKHKNLTVSNGVFGEKTIKNQYICNNCKKEYNSRNGLWKHKKSCKNAVNTESKGDNNIFSNETTNKDEFIKYLMEENIYFKNIVLEISKNITVDKATIE